MSAMPDWIWLDGDLVDAHAPHLRVSDRGFQLGDGIFETGRARRGIVVELDEHLERLREGAAALSLNLPIGDEALVEAIADLLAAEGLSGAGGYGTTPGDAALRITVSRGPFEQRGLLPPGIADVPATIAIQAWPYVPPPAELLARGVQAVRSSVRRDPASPLAGIKSTSRADYVYAKLEAARAGADDALFLTIGGAISEGTSANVFVIAGRTLGTPPRAAAILPGTTRTWLLAHAQALGFDAAEVELRPEQLLAADEAFLSSSIAGIVPLTAFDGRPIGAGRPGPRTLALRQAREAWIDAMSLAALLEDPADPEDAEDQIP
jgi:branched-chain amino acid aminotransferase